MFLSGSTSYFFKSPPDQFGSQQQEKYLSQKQIIVTEAHQRLTLAVKNRIDLTKVFHEILDFFSQERKNIAHSHNINDADLYGVLRDAENDKWLSTMLTSLYEYRDSLFPELENFLSMMVHDNNEFTQKELKIHNEAFLNKKSSFEIIIFSIEQHDKWKVDFTYDNYERLCGLCNITPENEEINISELFHSLTNNQMAMRHLKKVSMDDYKKIKLNSLLYYIYHNEKKYHAQKISDWVLATVRVEINGKLYAMSQYFTWMCRNLKDDPIQNMKDSSGIFLVHQDSFLIKDTLDNIAILFREAIEWNGENISDLINKMALINYLFAHATPYIKGSASIGEWLELTIYAYHGLSVEYNENHNIHKEALISPLNRFVEKYPNMINLTCNLDSSNNSIRSRA